MSVLPNDEIPPRRKTASDTMQDTGEFEMDLSEARKRNVKSQANPKKNNGVAQRDANVAKKINKQAPAKGKNGDAPPAPAAKTPAYETTKVNIPLTWHISPQNQALVPIDIGAALNEKGIDGEVSVLSASGVQSANTVQSPLYLSLVGFAGKDQHVTRGSDIAGNKYTTMIPRRDHVYELGSQSLYTRGSELDTRELAQHMKVDVQKLQSDVMPYYGKNGRLAQTHIEVHESANPDLYKLINESKGLETLAHGDSVDNPSVILSRTEHKQLIDAYKGHGGYARTGRVHTESLKAYLHHLGTSHESSINSEAWNQTTKLGGLTLAEKKDNAAADASHTVTYEMEMVVAHKPKAKPSNSSASQNEDSDDE